MMTVPAFLSWGWLLYDNPRQIIPIVTPVTTDHGTSIVWLSTARANPNTPITGSWSSRRSEWMDGWTSGSTELAWSCGSKQGWLKGSLMDNPRGWRCFREWTCKDPSPCLIWADLTKLSSPGKSWVTLPKAQNGLVLLAILLIMISPTQIPEAVCQGWLWTSSLRLNSPDTRSFWTLSMIHLCKSKSLKVFWREVRLDRYSTCLNSMLVWGSQLGIKNDWGLWSPNLDLMSSCRLIVSCWWHFGHQWG